MKPDINDAMAHAAAIAICAERTNGTVAWEDAEEDLKSECLKDAFAALRAADDCAAAISGDRSTSLNADICRYAESGWLIENGPVCEPTYWGYLGDEEEDTFGWTIDHSRAMRFARKIDGERYVEDVGWNDVRVCEHIWDGARLVTKTVQQHDAFTQFTDFRRIPSEAIEAAAEEFRGYCDPSESRMATAIAAAVRILIAKTRENAS